jgi:hypothetical protein
VPDQYIKLSEEPLLDTPARGATVIIEQAGEIRRVPLEAICDIDPSLAGAADLEALDPQPPPGAWKRLYNPGRDRIEFWRRGDDGQWHRVL